MENMLVTTLKMVARLAGVSVTTASRALNGYPDVNEETRTKIKRVAQDMNYRPNVLARSLVTKRSRAIGVILSEMNRSGAKDALMYEILCGINDRASELDYDIMLFSTTPKKQLSKSYSDLCKEWNVSGAIIAGLRVNDPYLEEVASDTNFPCVLIDIPVEGNNVGHVTADDIQGARVAVRHLIQLGHRNIAMINGHNQAVVSYERLKGYQLELEQNGLAFKPGLVFDGKFTEEGGFAAMEQILREHPDVTAVFSASDLMVLGALRAAEQYGRKVPESVSIVGYDDIAIASYCTPRITTIKRDKYEMGYQSAQLLLDMLTKQKAAARKIILYNELIVRESTARPTL